MSNVNDFVPFCPTDTGTNLVGQSTYASGGYTPRVDGNQPGVASSALNNKALRQSSFIASQVAQLIVDQTSTDVLDDANAAKFLLQLKASVLPLAPVVSLLGSSSGTYRLSYYIFCATASATSGATYSDGTTVFTVSATIAAKNILLVTGGAAPIASGTLTKTGGSGDATIAFYSVRAPVSLAIEMVGGGGGGGGSSTNGGGATDGSNGGDTSFGPMTAQGGRAGRGAGGGQAAGGSATLGSGPVGLPVSGGSAASGSGTSITNTQVAGGNGGSSACGGAGGAGGQSSEAGADGATNAGGGGGGGGYSTGSATLGYSGRGGGSGGFIKALITNTSAAWAATFAWAVGAGGAHGNAGTSGANGGVGGSGAILAVLNFQ